MKNKALILAGFLLVVFCCNGCKKTPPDWIALLEAFIGQVQYAEASGGLMKDMKKKDYLRGGNVLQTGPQSEALLALRAGGKIKIKPNSLVLLNSEVPDKKLKLALEKGSLEVGTASVDDPNAVASELVIGVGDKQVLLTGATRAQIEASKDSPKIQVMVGKASVVDNNGVAQEVLAGNTLVLTAPKAPEPAASQPAEEKKPTEDVVEGKEIVFYLKSVGTGKTMIQAPNASKFTLVKNGQSMEVEIGTKIKLFPNAKVVVGSEDGKGTTVTGPAQVKVVAGAPGKEGEPAGVRLEPMEGEIKLTDTGAAGKTGSSFMAEGVRITPRITYKHMDVRLKKEKNRSVITVAAGEALLVGKDQNVRLESGQDAILQKGKIIGPTVSPTSALVIKSAGNLRVFVAGKGTPVSFQWNSSGDGKNGGLVEIGRSPNSGAIFSDVIHRKELTMKDLKMGTYYWQFRTKTADGKLAAPVKGSIALVKDTSWKLLKERTSPKNLIQETFGNTTVFYQNLLPNFTFKWNAMERATKYQVKIFRDNNLTQPVILQDTDKATINLGAGKLTEGTYVWYVVGRESGGGLVKTTPGRKLSIRYDNATPDLQIVFPPNDLVATEDTITTEGVTMPGTKLTINGASVTLDDNYRFKHPVTLKPGANQIIFTVTDARRGTSMYLRQVTR